jgi:hypothetical protein
MINHGYGYSAFTSTEGAAHAILGKKKGSRKWAFRYAQSLRHFAIEIKRAEKRDEPSRLSFVTGLRRKDFLRNRYEVRPV